MFKKHFKDGNNNDIVKGKTEIKIKETLRSQGQLLPPGMMINQETANSYRITVSLILEEYKVKTKYYKVTFSHFITKYIQTNKMAKNAKYH